jgi:hypothetical protein
MSFNDSITKYRSVYFHFLDGLLNTDAGGTFDNVLLTLKEVAKINLNDIIFAKFSINRLTYKMIFNDKQNVTFNYFNEELTIIPLDLLKFCIIPMSFNKHQTTTIIFTKNDKLYLFILNTGLDMEKNGNTIKIDDKDLYQLTKGVCLCDNINNETLLNSAYNQIKDFLFVSFFYKYITNNNYSETDKSNYIFNDDFKNLLKTNYFKFSQEKIFNLENQIYNFDELSDFKIVHQNYKNKDFLDITPNYYLLVSNLINQHPNIVNIRKVNKKKIVRINDCNIDSLKIINELNESFLRKIILYNQEDNLYIFPQESGSCTWYSIYF